MSMSPKGVLAAAVEARRQVELRVHIPLRTDHGRDRGRDATRDVDPHGRPALNPPDQGNINHDPFLDLHPARDPGGRQQPPAGRGDRHRDRSAGRIAVGVKILALVEGEVSRDGALELCLDRRLRERRGERQVAHRCRGCHGGVVRLRRGRGDLRLTGSVLPTAGRARPRAAGAGVDVGRPRAAGVRVDVGRPCAAEVRVHGGWRRSRWGDDHGVTHPGRDLRGLHRRLRPPVTTEDAGVCIRGQGC